MSVGPVELAVVKFPGNKFKGEIVPALRELIGNETIKIIDLAFVLKTADGATEALELTSLPEDVVGAFQDLDGEVDGLLNDEDLEAVAAGLPADSSAVLLVWEDSRATRLVDAVRGAGGELAALERVPREQVMAALAHAGIPA
ncbi:MAG TPA: DUF6325 family protein [Actinocrinis sp.]|nr:DUF6325 family protein [Actinocrinis sp.]